ncbi:DNA-directed RNA polymerase subunit delta [Alicyclobacillus fastidiosus]|uniref:Probable DNA-directed RNA polymerase subunit delta n=1 Tax=Alicyclobacillus fastidiosus TaxID=392011 RepID=A0ABV5AFY8_9BACL|nr:DNA-directed RNA polymerase subunit delta [Alicyclobacillus fastidiosus]WEH09624.1 DNA-directed RNA polymerase subunit delta [Alicyclobacillus fastidiosus]
MAVTLTRPDHEIQQMPLVELAYEILKAKKEPLYFRDIMQEIRELRGLSEDEFNELIARVYTEINIDGRFICIGQNVWGLNRWYPTDKVADRLSGKKFVRKSGDAFGDDDEDLDEDYEDADVIDSEESDYDASATDDDAVDFESSDDDEEELSEDEEFEEEAEYDEDDEDQEEEED